MKFLAALATLFGLAPASTIPRSNKSESQRTAEERGRMRAACGGAA